YHIAIASDDFHSLFEIVLFIRRYHEYIFAPRTFERLQYDLVILGIHEILNVAVHACHQSFRTHTAWEIFQVQFIAGLYQIVRISDNQSSHTFYKLGELYTHRSSPGSIVHIHGWIKAQP